MGDVPDLGVDERRRVRRQGDRRAGDAARSPRLQPAGGHLRPHPREPVAQLDRLTEVGAPGVGRHPDRGGELGYRELRHQRGARTGDRMPVSP